MARQVYRPYVKIVTHTSNITAADITLLDTSGETLNVNYVSVEASGGSTGNFFVVHASSIQELTDPAFGVASGLVGHLSGTCGGAAPTIGGAVELVLSDGDRISGISISHSIAEAVTYFVTYGQVSSGSDIADGRVFRGK
jgi:hypothetical protein